MPKYKTLGMAQHGGFNKDLNDYNMMGSGATYLLESERLVYKVEVGPMNRLYRGGQLLDTTDAVDDNYIFVMDGDGRIFSEDKILIKHHSAFLAGGPVAAAGHWCVVNGVVSTINNESGHYMPPQDYTEQILTELISRGYSVTHVQRNFAGGTAKQVSKLRKRRGTPVKRLGPKGVVSSNF